jgi:hypothetical protein
MHHASHHLSPTEARTGLAIHAAIYVVINAMLAVINLSSPGDLWFQWPLLGWGLGLAFHAWVVSRHVGLNWSRHTDSQHLREDVTPGDDF